MRRRDCFIIEQGCSYEGGGVVAVSLSFEKAEEYSLKLVEKEQEKDDKHRAYCLKSHIEFVLEDPEKYNIKDPENYTGEDYKHSTKDWKTEDFGGDNKDDEERYWTNGMDYISIKKQKLI